VSAELHSFLTESSTNGMTSSKNDYDSESLNKYRYHNKEPCNATQNKTKLTSSLDTQFNHVSINIVFHSL
jgi:hypothetical protein